MLVIIYWISITLFYVSTIRYYKTAKEIYAVGTTIGFIGTWFSLISMTTVMTPLVILVYCILLYVQYKCIIRT